MATTFNELNIALRGPEATQLFLEPIFMDSDIQANYMLMPSVSARKNMAFVQELERVVQRNTGCGFTPQGTMGLYQRDIEVFKMKVNLAFCVDEFFDTIYETALRSGTSLMDIRETVYETVLLQRVREAIMLDIQRLIYFGDTSAANADYNLLDGLWRVYYPALATANAIPRVTTGSGTALAAGAGLDIIQSVARLASNQLKGLPNDQKAIYVTSSIYEQYVIDLQSTTGSDLAYTAILNGIPNLTYRGIPVIPMYRWDRILATDFSVTLPHYIEYRAIRNVAIATDVLDPTSELRVWFEEKDDQLYVKANFKLGVNYVHPSLVAVGF